MTRSLQQEQARPKMPGVRHLREILFIWGEARDALDEGGCTELDTGACASFIPSAFEWCDGCKRSSDAWDTLSGIERVMDETYHEMREAGYER